MASTSKCPYCGGTVQSNEKNCPHCNAINESYIEDTERQIFQPKTIDELKEYCAERGMPLLRMHFFIGENYQEPKAFGIYQDGDHFVVYKNKADGSRAIRYQGPDEAYAVNELFQKLLSECHNRGIYPDGEPATKGTAGKQKASVGQKILMIVFMLLMFAWIPIAITVSCVKHRNDGYYSFNNDNRTYYRYGNDWYYSDTVSSDWYSGTPIYVGDYEDYYVGKDYDSDWGVTDFKSSDTYDDLTSSDSDSSSSSYDSWDSGGTDWSSDW